MKRINIREALLELDRKTDCRYDLTTLYEACKLDDDDKNKLVKYIDAYDHPATINKFLTSKCDAISEGLADDDVSDMKIVDEINDGGDRTLWNLMDKFEDEDLQLKELKEDVDPEVLQGRLDNIDYAMNHYAKDSFFIDDVQGSGTEYKVTYNGVTVDVTFDTEWEELTYYINGKGPYCHSSYEYIVSDIMNFVDYNHLGQSDDEVDESLTEDVDTSNLESDIKAVVNQVMADNGYDEDEIAGYTAIEIKDVEENFVQVEVRAELGYDDLMELCDKLNPIVAAIDHRSYFEPVTTGIARAFVRKDQSEDIVDEEVVNQWTNKIYDCASMDDLRQVYITLKDHIDNDQYSIGTQEAILDEVHKKADMLNESLTEDVERTVVTDELENYIIEALGIESYTQGFMDTVVNFVTPYKEQLFNFEYMILRTDDFEANYGEDSDLVIAQDNSCDVVVYKNVNNVKFNYPNHRVKPNAESNSEDSLWVIYESLTEDAKEEYFVGDDETGRIYYNEKDAQAAFDGLKKSGIANPVKMKVTDMREDVNDGWVKRWNFLDNYYKDDLVISKISSPTDAWHVERVAPNGHTIEHLGNYNSLEAAKAGATKKNESKLTLNESDDTDILYDMEDYDEDNTTVTAGNSFIEDGYTWTWFKQCGDTVHLDFDNWAVWWAYRPEVEDDYNSTAISGFFVVDTDTGFIDWGPCDTVKEAQEFLQSKVNDWENDDIDESKPVKESYRQDTPDNVYKVGDRVAQRWTDEFNVGTVIDIKEEEGTQYKVEWDYSEGPSVEWLYGTDISLWIEEENIDESKSIKESIDTWEKDEYSNSTHFYHKGDMHISHYLNSDTFNLLYAGPGSLNGHGRGMSLGSFKSFEEAENAANEFMTSSNNKKSANESKPIKEGVQAADEWYLKINPEDTEGAQELKGLFIDDVIKNKGNLDKYGFSDRLKGILDKEFERYSPMITEASEGFQKEFYKDYVILKNRAGDGWDVYSYTGTPEKVKSAHIEEEGCATLDDAKAFIDSLSESLTEDADSDLGQAANKVFEALKEYGAKRMTKYLDTYKIYWLTVEDDGVATLVNYAILEEGFKEVAQYGNEPNITDYINEAGDINVKLLIYNETLSVEVSKEDASQYNESLKENIGVGNLVTHVDDASGTRGIVVELNGNIAKVCVGDPANNDYVEVPLDKLQLDEALKEGVEKYIIRATEDGLNLYYNSKEDHMSTDMKEATIYSEREIALDDYKAVKERYPKAYIRSIYDLPLFNKPSKKEGFEEDEWDDDELASIYGGDTKYDMPDGVETPEETEARLAKERENEV